eukprot:5450732-Amphidinium_carterae.1
MFAGSARTSCSGTTRKSALAMIQPQAARHNHDGREERDPYILWTFLEPRPFMNVADRSEQDSCPDLSGTGSPSTEPEATVVIAG